MSRSKDAGTRFETWVARWLSDVFGDARIDRMALHGAHDRGDVSGIYAHGQKVVVECKNCRSLKLSKWISETEDERDNSDALAGVCFIKRRGCGEQSMGDQYVLMTARDFVSLVSGVKEE